MRACSMLNFVEVGSVRLTQCRWPRIFSGPFLRSSTSLTSDRLPDGDQSIELPS